MKKCINKNINPCLIAKNAFLYISTLFVWSVFTRS